MNGITGLVNNPYPLMNVSEKTYCTIARSQVVQLKRVANGTDPDSVQQNRTYGASSIISSSQAFANTIRESRIKSKETSNEVKKLQYNFKDISSQIMRSKTSLSAKQAASKARREVLRLRRAKAAGMYDEEEVNAALEHAKAMERVAKKKAAHLQQEEMIHITDEAGTGRLAEELKEHPEKPGEEEKDVLDELTQPENTETGQEEAAREMMVELSENMEEITSEMSDQLDEMMQGMSELMSEITDQMTDMLEDLDLLTELSAVPKEMNEADYKMLVTKHRTDEMKEMAEADREYLKFIFDKYEKMRSAAMTGSAAAPVPSGTVSFAPMPEMTAEMPAMGGGLDISV
ncbi:MAG: hypothetical protein IKS16_08060 [Lachnospiraceae bacterium]|nr:hypothetical protein [Lachnospiraceae bacterium]